MAVYLDFDATDIEEEVYEKFTKEIKEHLKNPKIIMEINLIRFAKAGKILEDEEINTLNMDMFKFALDIIQREQEKE